MIEVEMIEGRARVTGVPQWRDFVGIELDDRGRDADTFWFEIEAGNVPALIEALVVAVSPASDEGSGRGGSMTADEYRQEALREAHEFAARRDDARAMTLAEATVWGAVYAATIARAAEWVREAMANSDGPVAMPPPSEEAIQGALRDAADQAVRGWRERGERGL